MQTPPKGSRDHLYVLIPVCAVLVAFCWMVTYGDFALFDSENFGQFYDGQAASLLAGHWDVPLQSIEPEQYLYGGKTYGYFGFVPALPRMVLNYFFPMMAGAWSRTSLLLGCAATLYCSYSILLRARRWLGVVEPLAKREKIAFSLFLVLVGLGSTTIYLGSRAFIYHEAIIWSVALALAFFDQLLGYLMDGRFSRLATMCILAFLCFFCRASTGCGPVFALVLMCVNVVAWHVPARWTELSSGNFPGGAGVLARSSHSKAGEDARAPRMVLTPSLNPKRIATGCLEVFRQLAPWNKPPPLFHAAVAGTTILTVVITFIAINHAKFGTFFDASPMQHYAMMALEPGRYQRSGGKFLRLGNIPTVLLAYTSIDAITFDGTFPWVYLQWQIHKFPGSHMDGVGGYSSVMTAMPVFVLLALASGRILSRHSRTIEQSPEPAPANTRSLSILILGLIAGLMPVLAFCAVDNRYLHEFLPLLVVLGAFGIRNLFTIRRPGFTLAIPCLLIGLGIFQIYADCSFALSYQRSVVFGVPAKPRAQMRQWQRTIDRSLKNLFRHPG